MGTNDPRPARPSVGFGYLTLRSLTAQSGPICCIDAHDDWDRLRARIAATPGDAQIRGLFPGELLRTVDGIAPVRARYIPFSNYPMTEYLDLIVQAAQIKYPIYSAGNAVLRLGLDVFGLFATSLAGQTIFSLAHRNFQSCVERSPKAYEVTLRPGRVNVVESSSTGARVELRGVWAFPDIFHAGIWLGAMKECRVEGTIEVTRHSPCDVDFHLEWQPH